MNANFAYRLKKRLNIFSQNLEKKAREGVPKLFRLRKSRFFLDKQPQIGNLDALTALARSSGCCLSIALIDDSLETCFKTLQ